MATTNLGSATQLRLQRARALAVRARSTTARLMERRASMTAALAQASRFRTQGFSESTMAQFSPEARAQFQAEQDFETQRAERLAAATQRIVDPSLSGAQEKFVGQVGGVAGARGLFGGAVDVAQERTAQQFVAGNRLMGLQAVADDFFDPGFRGVSPSMTTAGGPAVQTGAKAAATLSQILGLKNQFAAGNFGALTGLDVSALGAFAARRVPLAGVAGRPEQVGTGANELSRRVAEGLGFSDTNKFIRENTRSLAGLTTILQSVRGGQPQATRDITAGRLQGLFGSNAGTVADITRRFLGDQSRTFFGTTRAAQAGPLGGLVEAGLLPFMPRFGSTLPRAGGASRELASRLFSFGV